MELILIMFAGIITGSIVGILPGIGPAMILLVIAPLLVKFDLVTLFVFYSCLISSSQYFGSISAIVYGVPGEISSVPAVDNGHALFRKGQGAHALSCTSTASLLASIFGVLIMLVIYLNADQLLWFYDMHVLMIIYFTVMMGMVLYTNKPWLSFIFMIAGLVLGKIGYDSLYMTHILVPKYTSLDSGIPYYAIFSGFIVIPELIKYITKRKKFNKPQLQSWPTFSQRFKNLFFTPHKASIIRGSLIGSLMGLVPGCSYMLSSNVADRTEKKFNDSKLSRLLAAESANNSAAITVLLPLLLFGIPIVFSEAIIMSIAETKGFGYTVSFEFIKNYIPTLSIILFLGNVVSWIISGIFYSIAIRIYNILMLWIYHILIILIIFMVFWAAIDNHQIWLGMSVFLITSIIGIMIPYKDSKFVLVFAFFISDNVIDALYRFYIIYS
jgi:putative tricarboxylic transport membrane protein